MTDITNPTDRTELTDQQLDAIDRVERVIASLKGIEQLAFEHPQLNGLKGESLCCLMELFADYLAEAVNQLRH